MKSFEIYFCLFLCHLRGIAAIYNLAPGKTVTVFSLMNDPNTYVRMNHAGEFTDGDEVNTCVSFTGYGVYLTVDLVKAYTINLARLIFRGSFPANGTDIFYDDDTPGWPFRVFNSYGREGIPHTVTFDVQRTGVVITFDFEFESPVEFDLCEIEINGCEVDHYGDDCLPCNKSENCEVCDVNNGACYICREGYTGPNCSIGTENVALQRLSQMIAIDENQLFLPSYLLFDGYRTQPSCINLNFSRTGWIYFIACDLQNYFNTIDIVFYLRSEGAANISIAFIIQNQRTKALQLPQNSDQVITITSQVQDSIPVIPLIFSVDDPSELFNSVFSICEVEVYETSVTTSTIIPTSTEVMTTTNEDTLTTTTSQSTTLTTDPGITSTITRNPTSTMEETTTNKETTTSFLTLTTNLLNTSQFTTKLTTTTNQDITSTQSTTLTSELTLQSTTNPTPTTNQDTTIYFQSSILTDATTSSQSTSLTTTSQITSTSTTNRTTTKQETAPYQSSNVTATTTSETTSSPTINPVQTTYEETTTSSKSSYFTTTKSPRTSTLTTSNQDTTYSQSGTFTPHATPSTTTNPITTIKQSTEIESTTSSVKTTEGSREAHREISTEQIDKSTPIGPNDSAESTQSKVKNTHLILGASASLLGLVAVMIIIGLISRGCKKSKNKHSEIQQNDVRQFRDWRDHILFGKPVYNADSFSDLSHKLYIPRATLRNFNSREKYLNINGQGYHRY